MSPAVRDGLVKAFEIALWLAASSAAAVLIHMVAEWVRRQWSEYRRREQQRLPRTITEHNARVRLYNEREQTRRMAEQARAHLRTLNPLTIEQRRDRATEKKSA